MVTRYTVLGVGVERWAMREKIGKSCKHRRLLRKRPKVSLLTQTALKQYQVFGDRPGMVSAKSLILKARLKPLAKKPPKGPIREPKTENTKAWIWNG